MLSLILRLAPLAILSLGLQIQRSYALNHDVAWLLVAAERLVGGQKFGQHIFELNAPGAVLIYAPAVALMNLLGLEPQTAVVLYATLIGGGALLIARGHLASLLSGRPPWLADAITVFWVSVWLVGAGAQFAQREHLIVALLLPFVLVEARSACGDSPSLYARAGTAVLAALAMMIKPQYVFVLGVFLLVRLLRTPLSASFRSPEPYVFLIAGLAYLASVQVFFREWWDVARAAYGLYSAYDVPDRLGLVWNTQHGLLPVRFPLISLAPLALGSALVSRIDHRLGLLLRRFLLLGACALLIFWQQGKGFTYHLIPFAMAVAWSVPVVLAGAVLWAQARGWGEQRPVLFNLAGVAVCLALVGALYQMAVMRASRMPSVADRDHLFQSLTPGSPVFVFSSDLQPGFPAVVVEGHQWGSRFPCLWPLAGIVHQRALHAAGKDSLPVDKLDSIEREMLAQVVEDLERFRPVLVVVDRSQYKHAIVGDFDFVAYFERDEAFRLIWADYVKNAESRMINGRGPFDFYRLNAAPASG